MSYPPIATREDIQKLHAESHQLRNQQFVLGNVGLTAVGLSSWFIPRLPADPSAGHILGIVSILMIVLLAVLFGWSIILRRLIATISRYLQLRGASEWEPLFRRFSTQKGTCYWSQTVFLAVFYLVLGGVVVTNFFLVAASGKISPPPLFNFAVPVTGAFFATFVLALTYSRHAFDRKALDNWVALLNEQYLPGLPALKVTRDAVKTDFALAPGARGARKLVVTTIYAEKEQQATIVEWLAPSKGEKCPVHVMPNAEVSVFNQHAAQDRHFHRRGTEVYMAIEGEMVIDVEGVEYRLLSGDMIIVNPNAVHQVKPADKEFLCRVITLNCGGPEDKFQATEGT